MKILYILLLLIGCSPTDKPIPHVHRYEQNLDTFKSHVYIINENEHVTEYTIPGKYAPIQCWALVNDLNHTQSQHCDEAGVDENP